ncbi:hypothetical protein E2C01_015481 [Portunus trituberculatus]|uniref:Uncharacterized protein n=1 Tax=Portunus trituberculatus TaxID=210409 RepID=A0A5B7DMW7_PORTR|nr:hypothetical protein [Portunus trituberculatus]
MGLGAPPLFLAPPALYTSPRLYLVRPHCHKQLTRMCFTGFKVRCQEKNPRRWHLHICLGRCRRGGNATLSRQRILAPRLAGVTKRRSVGGSGGGGGTRYLTWHEDLLHGTEGKDGEHVYYAEFVGIYGSLRTKAEFKVLYSVFVSAAGLFTPNVKAGSHVSIYGWKCQLLGFSAGFRCLVGGETSRKTRPICWSCPAASSFVYIVKSRKV